MENIISGGAPAVVHGKKSDSVFIFVHGQGGSKDEAQRFADIANPLGFQVLAVDLPGHGERTDAEKFVPWEAVPELCAVMRYAKSRWKHISVRAISIGAWFSLLAFADETIEKCLLSSPLLDMENMILSMMAFDGVTEERLRNEKEIVVFFGRTLSWDYLEWASIPTRVIQSLPDFWIGSWMKSDSRDGSSAIGTRMAKSGQSSAHFGLTLKRSEKVYKNAWAAAVCKKLY